MSDRQQKLVYAAVRYAEMGWPVFPCHPTGHQPLVKKGFYAATTNIDAIGEWWSAYLFQLAGAAGEVLNGTDCFGHRHQG